MQIVLITKDDLQEVIKETVSGLLNGIKTEEKPTNKDGEFLTRRQAAQELGVCLATLDNLVKTGRLKKYRNGSIVRLKRSEVETFYSSFQKYQRA